MKIVFKTQFSETVHIVWHHYFTT